MEWERSNTTLDECLDKLRSDGCEGKPAVSSLLFEYFRHKEFVDQLIASRAKKGAVRQDLRNLLACAVTQMVFQTGIAAQSAANIAVDCAKRKFGRGPSAFVNAILRAILASDEIKTPPPCSFPQRLRAHWIKEFGEEQTTHLIENYATNPLPSFRLRNVGLPGCDEQEIYREISALPFKSPFRFYEILKPEKFFKLNWLEKGIVYVQDPATMVALSLLGDKLKGKVLDACAAPGGKSILLWDLAKKAGSEIQLTAADRSLQRINTLKENLQNAGVTAEVLHASAEKNPFKKDSFDLILADVPCGNSGVIRRRCDVPWHFSTSKLADIVKLQAEILNALAQLVKPGGALLYSTCSIEQNEDEKQIENFLAKHPDFRFVRQLKQMPSALCDGAFGALLERIS